MKDIYINKTCNRHGNYEAKLVNTVGNKKIYSLCPECLKENAIDERNMVLLSERIDNVIKKNSVKASANIPERFSDASFDSFKVDIDKQEEAKYIATDYCKFFDEYKNSGVNLIFYGFVGTGKTLLAAAIANELIANSYSVRFSSVLKITAELKSTYSEDSPTSHNEIIDNHSEYDLLVLDEVGVQNNTRWELNVLYELINRRYEKKLPTLVITNIDPKDLEGGKDPNKIINDYMIQHLGVRVIDRLRENDSILIFFSWDSYRRKTYRKSDKSL